MKREIRVPLHIVFPICMALIAIAFRIGWGLGRDSMQPTSAQPTTVVAQTK